MPLTLARRRIKVLPPVVSMHLDFGHICLALSVPKDSAQCTLVEPLEWRSKGMKSYGDAVNL